MEPLKEPDLRMMGSDDFSPEKYVKELSQRCVGGPELRRLCKKVKGFSDDTNSLLKRNVYQNYMQFIESAKEISHLESEMYQLSHLLSEQKSLLSSLATTSILGDENVILRRLEENKETKPNKEEINREKIAQILEKVEGCKEVLEVPGRVYLYEGSLLELDPVENTVIKFVQAFLFSDGLMIAKKNSNSRELMKYIFEAMYELGSLAVVNVRDLGSIKHAFKLLIFPDTRVFKCQSSTIKKEWLEKFDQAKKARLSHDQKRDSISEKPPSRSASIDYPSLNPFEEQEEEPGFKHPDWFLEIPEELDVCIAQRHFEEAVVFLQKSKDYIAEFLHSNNNQPDHVLSDIQRKVEQKHNVLTDVLTKELEVKPDKSLQGGLKASRRAVRLLNQLERSNQACDLFLKLCTCMLKIQYKRVKREGSTTMYIKHLSSVIFTNICHMTEEFLRAFPDSPTCYSVYVVWVSRELSQFTTHFIKQAFVPQTSFRTLTECIVHVRWQCDRLCSYGVDLGYQVDGALRTYITKALKDAKDKLCDSVKVRASEDKWIPTNLKSKTGLTKFLQEYSEMGLKLDSYITGDVWLQLTTNTLAFTKLIINLLNDVLKIRTTELIHAINETLYSVFDAQIRHNELALRSEKESEQRKFITKNAEFLLVTLVDVCQKKYKEEIGFSCETLSKLQKEYSALLNGISPTSRNTTRNKYSSDFL